MFFVFHTGSVADIKMVCEGGCGYVGWGGGHQLFCHLSGGFEKISGETGGIIKILVILVPDSYPPPPTHT